MPGSVPQAVAPGTLSWFWARLSQRICCSRDAGGQYTNLDWGGQLAGVLTNDIGDDDDDDEERKTLKTDSVWFQLLVGSVIMANTLVIFLEVIYIQSTEVWQLLQRVEIVFTLLYVLELTLRVFEQGCRVFCFGRDAPWNIFDLSITLFSVIDYAWMLYTGQQDDPSVDTNSTMGRIARLFRVLRILRPFRALRFLTEIDYVILLTMKSMAKLSVIVALVIFVSSVIATNMLSDCSDPEVVAMFGNFWLSVWTMFQLMTLDSWIELTQRVLDVRPEMLGFFASYIFVASIAIMTLVPAIFIELNALRRDPDKSFSRCQSKQSSGKMPTRQVSPWNTMTSFVSKDGDGETSTMDQQQVHRLLRQLFKLTDPDRCGLASVRTLQNALRDEGILQALFEDGVGGVRELRDAQLILFEYWEEQVSARQGDPRISEDELLEAADNVYAQGPQTLLWRCTTATRMQMCSFHTAISGELDGIAKRLESCARNMGEDIASLPKELQTTFHATLKAEVQGIATRVENSCVQRVDAHVKGVQDEFRSWMRSSGSCDLGRLVIGMQEFCAGHDVLSKDINSLRDEFQKLRSGLLKPMELVNSLAGEMICEAAPTQHYVEQLDKLREETRLEVGNGCMLESGSCDASVVRPRLPEESESSPTCTVAKDVVVMTQLATHDELDNAPSVAAASIAATLISDSSGIEVAAVPFVSEVAPKCESTVLDIQE